MTTQLRNVFTGEDAARRYARGRVFFHPLVMARIADLPGVRGGLGLDVGCGTGLSSRALAGLCRSVVGIDPSRAMIARFERANDLDPVVAVAERVPLRNASRDVITLSQVIHWIDWSTFAAEARRVLRPGGWIVVYDLSFTGPDPYTAWHHGALQAHFPPPARRRVEFKTAAFWDEAGFRLVRNELFETTVEWTPDQLVDFLVCQSNVLAALDDGRETIESARRWIGETTEPFFAGAPAHTFAFDGPIVCATRVA